MYEDTEPERLISVGAFGAEPGSGRIEQVSGGGDSNGFRHPADRFWLESTFHRTFETPLDRTDKRTQDQRVYF